MNVKPPSVWTILFVILCTVKINNGLSFQNYLSKRKSLMREEQERSFGGDVPLQPQEIAANACLMKAKYEELDIGFRNPKKFLPSQNFLKIQREIENSTVYQIIRSMPKGGLLHAHTSAVGSYDFFFDRVLNRSNLYMCTKDSGIEFKFAAVDPDFDGCHWKLYQSLKESQPDLDELVRKNLSLIDPADNHIPDLNALWKKFDLQLTAFRGLLNYRPVFEDYMYESMRLLHEDNVLFMELRTKFKSLYDLDGPIKDELEIARIYQNVFQKFKSDYPDFIGVKAIYSPEKSYSDDQFDKHVQRFLKLKKAFPDLVTGFDLVGQEDIGRPIIDFAEKLLKLENVTNFLFHVGETNWYGQKSDENLYDAILLHTKRIGHGYALFKHPKLMEIVKNQSIAIELNPISNQVLGLVEDLRNHPAAYFFAENFPLVVSSDDPSFWGAKSLSHDFYEAFVGIMSRKSDLRALKKLALNSINYSTLDGKEKRLAWQAWLQKWKIFLRALEERCNVGVPPNKNSNRIKYRNNGL